MKLTLMKKLSLGFGIISLSAYAGNWTIEADDSKALSAPAKESIKFSVLKPEWSCELLQERLNFVVQSRSVVCASKTQSLVMLDIDCPIKGHEHGPTVFTLGRVGKKGMEFRHVRIGCELEKAKKSEAANKE